MGIYIQALLLNVLMKHFLLCYTVVWEIEGGHLYHH